MLSPTSPKLNASSVPGITALRRDLGYGESQLPRCGTFNDGMNAFRKSFTTSRGIAGVDLHNWNDEESQEGLAELTSAYLEAGNGQRFWPDDRAAANYNKYQYSEHHSHIKRLVKQLFFRLNNQQYRKHKYKNKPREEESGREDEGLLRQEDIRCEPPDETTNTPLMIHTDMPDRGFIGADTGNCSSASSDEFPSLSTLLARSARRKNSFTVPISSPGPSMWDLGRIGSEEDDKYSGLPSAKSAPRIDQVIPTCQATLSNNKRCQSFEDAPGGQAQPKRKKQTQQLEQDIIPPPTTPANRPQRQVPPRKADDFVRDLEEIGRRIDSDSESNLAPDTTPLKSRRQQRGATSRPSTRRADDGSGDADAPLVSPFQGKNTTQMQSSQARITTFFKPPTTPTNPNLSLKDSATPGACSLSSRANPTTLPEALPSSPALSFHSEDILAPLRSPIASTTPSSAPATTTITRTTTPQKGSVLFTYRLVLTRHPHTVTSRWAPTGGRFSDKTLPQLRRELPFRPDSPDSPGLIFYIASKCMRSVERIAYDDEDGFEAMKRYISREAGAWLGRTRRARLEGLDRCPGRERLIVDILIERMPITGSGEEARKEQDDQAWLEEPEVVEW